MALASNRQAKRSPITRENGTAVWTGEALDTYLVTGVTVHGRRFRLVCKTWLQADGINLWRGSVWLIRDGRRYLIRRVYN